MPPVKEPPRLIASLLNPVVATEPWEWPYRRICRLCFLVAASLLALTDLAGADLAVIPTDCSSCRGSYRLLARPDRTALARTQRFAEAVRHIGKPVVLSFAGERSHERAPLPGTWVLRRSMYGSRAGEPDVPLPEFFSLEPLDQIGVDQIRGRPWRPVPTVGFCGSDRRSISTSWRFTGCNARASGGWACRPSAASSCAVARSISWHRRRPRRQSFSPATSRCSAAESKSRREFLGNLLGADHQLSVRGSANDSSRPWQAMRVGRPPLFVDTDCAWPCATEVGWSKLTVVGSEADIGRLPEAPADFHAGLDEERFRALQEACRATWEIHLTAHGLARWRHASFRERPSV